MTIIHLRTCITLAFCAMTAAGCESNKSRNPLSPSVAGPIAGVTITAPKPLEPLNGQTITAGGTVTLLIENAATTGERPIWLQVEIATDAAFQAKVHVADKVPPGTEGRTSYQVPLALPAGGARYYWRARALDGANTGEFSATASFVLQDPVHMAVPNVVVPGQRRHHRYRDARPDGGQRRGRRAAGRAGAVPVRHLHRLRIQDDAWRS